MFFVLSRAWDKENILSPHKESNLRPSDSVLRCSTTEPQRLYVEQGLLQSSYMTHVLHTAKISNVDSVILFKWNKKDGNLRLGEGNFAGVR